MDTRQWKKIKEIYSAVAELSIQERAAILEQSDPSVRKEVEKLLAASESAGDFIASPIYVENGHAGVDDKSMLGRKIDDYVILEKLGEGGMGAVYLAEHRDQEFVQRVALKLIKRGMDTNAVLKRFFVERQILASLDHPNIARLLDGGSTEDGLPYFVMELVEGENIKNFCDAHQYDTNERLQLFQKVCQAISHAHQKLVVHRDIKPSNIVVTESGEPKLLDFGIAKLLGPDWEATTNDATATNFRLMTPEYASPEQLRGQMTTTATDVYSLGVVLYELLTGERPFKFKSKNPFEISEEILTGEPPRPSAVASGQGASVSDTDNNNNRTKSEPASSKFHAPNLKSLRGDLDNIILKAIRKDPKERYRSVEELADDIDRYLNGLPVRATADSQTYRLKKFVARNRVGSAVAALILLLSGVAVWQGIAANRERQKSDKRLVEIRQVAKSLMNETNDSLSQIPGNIAVQKALAEKSVALLDSLAAEENADTALLAELATAYTKLAHIQITAFREFDKATENLEKSNGIYQRILQKTPDDVQVRYGVHSMQMRYMQALQSTNRREEMFRLEAEVLKNRLELIRIEPETPSHYTDLAAMYIGAGSIRTMFGQNTEAVESYRTGVDIAEQAIQKQLPKADSNDAKAELARFYHIKGLLTEGAGELDNALENYQSSAEIAESVFQADATIYGNFSRVVGNYHEIASIYEKQNDFQPALNSYVTAQSWIEKGLKKTEIPEYSDLLYYKCYGLVNAGKMSEKMGRRSEARGFFAESETACWRHANQDENDVGNIIDLLPYFNQIADFYNAQGERKRAANHLLEISKRLQIAVEEKPYDLRTAFYFAETLEKIGDLDEGEQKRSFYKKSVQIWQDFSGKSTLLPTETEKMHRVMAKLEKIRQESP